MSERIEVGDLVQVVRSPMCCPVYDHLGAVFKVVRLGRGKCALCGTVAEMAGPDKCSGHSLHELKRMPPLSELETQEEREACPASS